MEFVLSGVIREAESRKPVPGLLVRALDKDLVFSDLLGNATTDSRGAFSMHYKLEDFRELFEKSPDIYLEIYRSSSVGEPKWSRDRPIFVT